LRELARDSNTAFILITHDLGIVARMTQRVHVMYAGQIVEKASTADLFANPRMPYTWGLLGSIPRLDAVRQQRLVPIEGLPPDLVSPPSGCRFQPRCRYRRDICREQEPPLARPVQTEEDHEARCWGTQNVPNGGWLIGIDWRRGSAGPDLSGAVVREVSAVSRSDGDVSPAAPASD